VVATLLAAPAAAQEAADTPFTSGITDAASLRRAIESRIAHARSLLQSIVALKGSHTVANTLRPYDDLNAELDTASATARVYATVHPDAEVRRTADALGGEVETVAADVQLMPELYRALAAVKVPRDDAKTRYYLERELRNFRLAGVDRPVATRARIAQLRAELTATMAEYLKNVRDGTRQVVVRDRGELAGLPNDFIARHQPDASGGITFTTDIVDARPVLIYADSEELRRRMYVESLNVGYPQNMAVLDRMLRERSELAHLLGFPNWAAYDTATRMAGDVETVSAFIDRVVAASGPGAAREYAELVERKRQDHPDAPFRAWDRQHYAELVRRASYDFDSQALRPYLPFDRVFPGLVDLTGRIFGLTFRRADTVPVWHPSVVVYDILDGATLLGRVYFDLHPRANKNTSGLTTTVRPGGQGRPMPESVLVASLPGGQSGDPGLMTHDEVTTLFHEIAHVVHRVTGGHQPWQGLSSVRVERDFVEVPSQMFEEWMWDPATLATFARHYQSGEPIPPTIVAGLRRAGEFGKALEVRAQMSFARMSLAFHERDPERLDTTALLQSIHNSVLPYEHVEGTHRQTSFTPFALSGYASTYYTYMWSSVIAKDMFSTFDRSRLSAPGVAARFRRLVFEPGSSKPAADLVRDFLGRPFNFAAWEAWVNSTPGAIPTQ
jgi:thimet oligopeptidase